MRIAWSELIERSPELAGLKADAASIAEQERWPWYPLWLAGSTIFAKACQEAAARLGIPAHVVKAAAVAGLVDAYRTAKARLRRKAGPGERKGRNHSRSLRL